MTLRISARVLFATGLLVAVGCTSLSSRGDREAAMTLRPEPVDLPKAGPPVPPATFSSQKTPAPSEPFSSATPARALDSRPSEILPAGPDQLPAKTAAGVPMAEMSAFIHELEATPHIDAATRSQILATAVQTPPELQSQLIRQYRALLALGQTATDKPLTAPAATLATTSPSAAVPPPGEPSPDPKKTSVVVAAHSEPVTASKSDSLTENSDSSDLESQLKSLLQKMKETKAEAGGHESSADPSEEPSSTDHDEVGDPTSSNATWQQLVNSAIKKLEGQRERRIDSDLREEDEARLRMLYLIADRRDDAVRAISSLEPEMQEFWSKQFFGLATLLNTDLITDRSNRLIESKRSLDEAVRRLGESSPLFVRNLAFITKVDSYGVYTPFDSYEFDPGQLVILYAEVENYCSEETARGYHTALRNSFEIFDSSSRKVGEHEFSTIEEQCKSPRRDYFTTCEFYMPANLHPGKYVLRLTVTDLNGDKTGESSITFRIRDKS